MTTELGPRAAALLAAGHIKLEGSELVGIASDGVEVTFGFADAEVLEAYLADHPTPEDW